MTSDNLCLGGRNAPINVNERYSIIIDITEHIWVSTGER
jgi:hypothetical protein